MEGPIGRGFKRKQKLCIGHSGHRKKRRNDVDNIGTVNEEGKEIDSKVELLELWRKYFRFILCMLNPNENTEKVREG